MEAVREQGITKSTVFQNKSYGQSHWFQSLTFHGDAEVSTVSMNVVQSRINMFNCHYNV
jgi:hypothetical protein